MKIIVIGNQKGGTGKTTTALMLANAWSQYPFEYKILLLDADPQKSAYYLREQDIREFKPDNLPYEIEVIPSSSDALYERLQSASAEYDYVLIDLAGVKNDFTEKALFYADFLIIPFIAGLIAIRSSMEYLNYALKVAQQRGEERKLQIIAFLNQYQKRAEHQDAKEHLSRKQIGWQGMENTLPNYAAFNSITTLDSSYPTRSTKLHSVRYFKKWIDELTKIVDNGEA